MNIAVREVVGRWQEGRAGALAMARRDKEEKESGSEGSGRKRKRVAVDEEGEEEGRQTRSRRTRGAKNNEGAPIEVLDSEDEGDEEFVPDGMAKCPICGLAMKAEQVFNHLDVCPGANGSQGRSTRSK